MAKPIPKSNADAIGSLTSPFPFENRESFCRKRKVSERVLILRLLIPDVNRDSAVGIATRYGLDGPGIESRLG
jgi:hypothetical protein